MLNYLVRLHLPDRPGALGAVASRIGSVGGDVVSFEILERAGGQVVDEMGVGLAGDGLVDLLREEILEVDGVTVESLRRVEHLPDRQAELLDLATDLFRRPTTPELLGLLTERVRAGLGAGFAAVVDPSGSRVVVGRGELVDRHRIETVARLAAAPAVGTPAVDDGVAAAHLVRADLVVLVGRRRPAFRDRERRWVSVMADIADHGCQDIS